MKRQVRPGGGTGKWLVLLALSCWLLGLGVRWTYSDAVDHALLTETIRISGKKIYIWPEGSVRVFEIVGDSRIQQGNVILASSDAVVWFDELSARTSGVARCLLYTEGGVRLVREGKTDQYQQFLADFASQAGITIDGPILTYEARQANPLFNRAEAVHRSQKPGFASTGEVAAEALAKKKPAESEEVEIFADNMNSWVEGDKRVVVATGNVTIRRGTYELTAERVVLWIPTAGGQGGKVQDLGQVYAEGDVTLTDPRGVVRAAQIFADRISNRSLMTNAEVRGIAPGRDVPFVFRGDEVRQLDEQRFVAQNGSITTDPYGKPHFKFKGKMMRLTQGNRAAVLSSSDNTLQVGNVPVAYWPFLSKDLRDDSWMLKNVSAGYSTDYGATFLTEWDLYDLGIYRNDWSTATLRLDEYTNRGFGLGGDFEYVGDHGFGFVKGYSIHDTAQFDRSHLQVEQPDRGDLRWEHRQFLPMGWRFDNDLSFLSDRGFLDEYNRSEYAEGTPQETFQYFRKLQDNAGLTLLFDEKINDFQTVRIKNDDLLGTQRNQFMVNNYLESPLFDTTAQKFPELGYHQIGQPLFGSLFSYSTDTRFDAVDLRYDRELLPHDLRDQQGAPIGPATPIAIPVGPGLFAPLENPPTTARLDTRHDLSLPFDLGPVRIEPMLSGRIQAESTSVTGVAGADDTATLVQGGPTARALIGPQVTAATDFWRVYDVHSTLLDVNRLKHIITPEFRYENSAIVTESPNRLNNFDPYSTVAPMGFFPAHLVPELPLPTSFNDFSRVESMDHMQRIVVELRQRLQTKRGRPGDEETVDLAELRLDYTAFPGNQGLNREFRDVYGDFFRGDLSWQIAKGLLLESRDNEWNTDAQRVEVANVGVNLQLPPDWNLYFGQRYIRDAYDLFNTSTLAFDQRPRNLSILGLEYTISPKYALTLVEQYDWIAKQNQSSKLIVSRKVPGWVIDFVLDVNPLDNNKFAGVQLTPIGLSKGDKKFW